MADRANNRPVAKAIIIVACLGAMAITAVGARSSLRAFDPVPWGRLLEGRLRESVAALHARVATLAELPTLAAAVSTDPRTVRDLTQDELAFRPRRGETVVIAQLPRGNAARVNGAAATGAAAHREATADPKGDTNNGAPVILLAWPERAHIPPLEQSAQPVIQIVANRLVLSEAIHVEPRERAAELQGVVAAAQQVDTDDLAQKFLSEGIGARVVVGGQTVDLVAPDQVAAAANASPVTVAVEGPSNSKIELLLFPSTQPTGWPYWIAAAALIAVALLLARRGRSTGMRISLPQTTPAIWTPASSPTTSWPQPSSATPSSVLIGATGRTIGRYQVVQHIGTGGMADVYLAHATGEAGFTKRIALKVLERSFARQAELVEHFLDEARLASLLDHPNIVQIIDLGRADDEYFIAMEYIDGADLARLIEITSRRGQPIPLPVVLAILRKICDGLQAAHTTRAADGTPLGLVHRDMKSGNVFVARNGVVKVGDFGIAMTNHASRVTRTQVGLVKGTPGYMAPEHRLGHAVDGRADMYGVGAIAYELLAGTLVNLDFSMLAQLGREGWPHLMPLRRFRKDIPPEMETVVFRALSYDAADRFADCAAMEAALEAIARKHPPVANDKTIARWIETCLLPDVQLTMPKESPRPHGRDN